MGDRKQRSSGTLHAAALPKETELRTSPDRATEQEEEKDKVCGMCVCVCVFASIVVWARVRR